MNFIVVADHPREWFTADLETINDVVNGIIAKLRMS